MLKQLSSLLKQVLTLAQATQANTSEIREIRRELKLLGSAVERLAYEFQRLRENEIHEREKIELRVENRLLRYERRLPSGPRGEEVDEG